MARLRFSGIIYYAFRLFSGSLSGVVGIGLSVLMVIVIYWYWKWWLLFILGLVQILGIIIALGQILRWRINPWILLLMLFLLIGWGFYIAYAPFSFWAKLLQTFLLGAPQVVFYKLLDISPWLYVKMLGSDNFNWHRWASKKEIWPYIAWERIFKLFQKKKFKSSVQSAVVFCLSLPFQNYQFSKKLQQVTFKHWADFSEEKDLNYSDTFSEKEYPVYNLSMEMFLAFLMHKEAMPVWIEQAKKEPEQWGLVSMFFQQFNNQLSQYIASPTEIYNTPILEAEEAESLIDLYINNFKNEVDETLLETAETTRGLLMLSMGIAAQMKNLPEETGEYEGE